ncbi:MAG TPA: UbiA-like polyprenyltransferase [Acidobacteriota bacterium]|jgi:4-hydroxybenzoate polyprenyltransferase
MNSLKNAAELLRMIKFEHTVFALPFAYLGAFAAAQGPPPWERVLWITLAMLGARSAAMCFNRLVDQKFDALNPRTGGRSLPAGRLSRRYVILFTLFSLTLMLYSASRLNRLCAILAPMAVFVIFFYSYTKRFTAFSHLFLGLSLAIAPIGGWIGVTGSLAPVALLLALAVGLWVSGFDIIYACQDIDFDSKNHLFSLPQAIGVKSALVVSTLLHLFMVVALIAVYLSLHLGKLSLAGIVLTAVLIAYEHWIVRPSDLSRVNTAFFTINGFVSILLFLAIGLDLSLAR